MVKAYLRYVEDDILNCLVGKHSNIVTIKINESKVLQKFIH